MNKEAGYEWGFGFAQSGGTLVIGVVALLLLGAAAALARQGPRARRAHGWSWLAMVPGGAALALCLWAAVTIRGQELPSALGLSPLVWCVGWLPQTPAASPPGAGLLALAGSAVVLLATSFGRSLDLRQQELDREWA